MDFTSEQTIAITTHDRNLIVTAGAGSGTASTSGAGRARSPCLRPLGEVSLFIIYSLRILLPS